MYLAVGGCRVRISLALDPRSAPEGLAECRRPRRGGWRLRARRRHVVGKSLGLYADPAGDEPRQARRAPVMAAPRLALGLAVQKGLSHGEPKPRDSRFIHPFRRVRTRLAGVAARAEALLPVAAHGRRRWRRLDARQRLLTDKRCVRYRRALGIKVAVHCARGGRVWHG